MIQQFLSFVKMKIRFLGRIATRKNVIFCKLFPFIFRF